MNDKQYLKLRAQFMQQVHPDGVDLGNREFVRDELYNIHKIMIDIGADLMQPLPGFFEWRRRENDKKRFRFYRRYIDEIRDILLGSNNGPLCVKCGWEIVGAEYTTCKGCILFGVPMEGGSGGAELVDHRPLLEVE